MIPFNDVDIKAGFCTGPYLNRKKALRMLRLPILLMILFVSLLWSTLYPTVVHANPVIGDAVTEEEMTPARSLDLVGCGGAQLPSSNLDYEAKVVELVNQIRLAHGLLPLKRVSQLDNAARFHATDMAKDDYFSHQSHDRVNGQLVQSCNWSDRIKTYYSDALYLSENIAAGYTSPEAVVKAWMDSQGHRDNILSPNNWEIGVGYFSGAGSYGHYWVQNFGRRQNNFPVIINGESAATDTGILTLHLYGQWQDVRFRSNDNGWAGWQPFQPVMNWYLEGDAGEHRIHVEMRSGSQVVSSSDTIYLTQSTYTAKLNQLPTELSFVYNQSNNQFMPHVYVLQPIGQSANGYTWKATVNANWLIVSPNEGHGAASVEIKPSASARNARSEIVLSLRNGGGEAIESHVIHVSIQTVNLSNHLYLPALQANRQP